MNTNRRLLAVGAAILAYVVLGISGCVDSSSPANPGAGGGDDSGRVAPPEDASLAVEGGNEGGATIINGCRVTEQVGASTISGYIPTCEAGYAHPNVCCRSGPREPTGCEECQSAPFRVCGDGSLAFPDPRTCCSLDDDTGCEEARVMSLLPDAGYPAGGVGSCAYACGPGGFPADELPDAGTSLAPCVGGALDGGSGVPCVYCCWTTPSSPCPGCPPDGTDTLCASNVCSCPAEVPGSPPCVCGPQCSACPAGWDVPASGQFDLCCRTNDAGVTDCFSIANSISSNGAVGGS